MLPLAHIYFGSSSWMSVESNCSNHIDPGGSHLVFNGDSSTGVPSSFFALQLLEFGFPHYKKCFLEVRYSSLEKSGTWVHGFWPSWADAPAASQKCWVGVEMQQSCHCKLEKVKIHQRLYLPRYCDSAGAHWLHCQRGTGQHKAVHTANEKS